MERESTRKWMIKLLVIRAWEFWTWKLLSDIADDTNAIAACRNTTQISVIYSVRNIISRKEMCSIRRMELMWIVDIYSKKIYFYLEYLLQNKFKTWWCQFGVTEFSGFRIKQSNRTSFAKSRTAHPTTQRIMPFQNHCCENA